MSLVRLLQSERRASAGDVTFYKKARSWLLERVMSLVRLMQSERRASAGDMTLYKKARSCF